MLPLAALAVTVVALAGVGVWSAELIATWRAERSADDATAIATNTGGAAAADLADRRAALLAADAERGGAEAQLTAAIEALDVAEADRQAVIAELDRLRAEVAALQSAATGTERDAQATAAQVGPLGVCLDGVSRLLNQVAVGDPGAARTVEAIGPACAAVGMALP